MRRNLPLLFAAAALVTAACSDSQLSPDRATAPSIAPGPRFSVSVPPPETCPTVESSQRTVDTLLPQIFGPGQGRRGTAQGYSNNIVQARRNGDTTLEQSYVETLINYTLANYYDGNLIGGQSDATQTKVLNFFYALYCASDIQPIPDLSDIFGAENTKLIRFNTPTTTVSAESAAVQIEQGEVPSTIFGTWVSVFRAGGPLPTSLDWYGVDGYRQGAWEFVANPPVEFTDDVLVGVCIEFDDAIVAAADLRLAHAVEATYAPTGGNTVVTTAGGTIEIAQYASPNPLGLDCVTLPPPSASRGVLGQWLHQFASLFVPQQLYAITSGGSTGGTVRKFSPFAAVDIKLNGTVTGPSSPQYIPIGSSQITAPVSVKARTRNDSTPIGGLEVTFAPASALSPALDTSDATGVVASTWTIIAGTNTGSATLTSPSPLSFKPAVSFAVTGVQLTTLGITTASPLSPSATAGVAYSKTLTASGGAGAGSYTWSLETGSSLPAGLGLSSAGVISGTPTAVGTFTFTVKVTSGGLTSTKLFELGVGAPTTVTLTFDQGPSKNRCYAVGVPMSPGITVKVTAGPGGALLSGVTVNLVAVTNNGAKVTVTPSSVESVAGYASFGGPTINKTGGYALLASTASPVAQATSTKFNISPSCP